MCKKGALAGRSSVGRSVGRLGGSGHYSGAVAACVRILAAAGAISRTRGISPQIRHSFAPRGRPSGKHLADAHSRMTLALTQDSPACKAGGLLLVSALDRSALVFPLDSAGVRATLTY